MNQQVKRNRYHIAILTLLTALLLCVPLSPSNLKAQQESDSSSSISPHAENNSKIDLSSLTNSEKNWLSAHKTISVAFDGHFPPYSFSNENGFLEGFSVKVMQLLADRLGITFKIFSQTTWKDLYQAAKNTRWISLQRWATALNAESGFSSPAPTFINLWRSWR